MTMFPEFWVKDQFYVRLIFIEPIVTNLSHDLSVCYTIITELLKRFIRKVETKEN